MNEIRKYDEAVQTIKTAILRSQYDAARSVNEKQLMLYYGIGNTSPSIPGRAFGARAPSTPSANGCKTNCRVCAAFPPGI